MKKPTLRLRQVFEGPTHFKVVKPLGNPIKIAKRGLSPNLMGRLRKFANGGEVSEQLDVLRKDIADEEARPDPSQDVLNFFREREAELLAQQQPEASELPEAAPSRPRPNMGTTGRPRPGGLIGSEEVAAARQAKEMLVNAADVSPVDITERPAAQPLDVIKMQPVMPAPERVVAGSLMGPPAPVAPVMTAMTFEPQVEPKETDLQFANRVIQEEMAKEKPDWRLVGQYADAYRDLIEAEQAGSSGDEPAKAE
jgi:hypothetical protein